MNPQIPDRRFKTVIWLVIVAPLALMTLVVTLRSPQKGTPTPTSPKPGHESAATAANLARREATGPSAAAPQTSGPTKSEAARENPADSSAIAGAAGPTFTTDTVRRLGAKRVLETRVVKGSAPDSTQVDSLIETNGKHPMVVLRQEYSGSSPAPDKLVTEKAFAASHVLAASTAGESLDAFQQRMAALGYEVLRSLRGSNIHVVGIKKPTLTGVDEAVQQIATAEPDYLVFTHEVLEPARQLVWVEKQRRFLDLDRQSWWEEGETQALNGTVRPASVLDDVNASNSGAERVLNFDGGKGTYRPYVHIQGFKVSRPSTDESVYVQNAESTGYPDNGGYYVRTLFSESSLVLQHKDGLPFTPHQVDLSEYSTVFPNMHTLQVVGEKAGGGTVTTSFTTDGIIDGTGAKKDFQTFVFPSNFQSLVKLTFNNAPFMTDNLKVTLEGQEAPPPAVPDLPVVYVAGWDEAPHQVGSPSEVGGRKAPTSLNFGLPVVRQNFGGLSNRPLEMVGGGGYTNYCQPRFDLALNAKRYRLEFDVTATEPEPFAIFFDGVTNFLRFDLVPSITMMGGSLAATSLDITAVNHVMLEVDLASQRVTLQVNGGTPVIGTIVFSLIDVADIRFSVTDAGQPGGMAIDNVVIQAFDIGGVGSAPRLTWYPVDGLNYGTLPLGSSSTRLVALRNEGGSNLTLTNAAIANPQFKLEGTLPSQLLPGQSFNVNVKYTPSSLASATSSLTFNTNDPNRPAVSIPLQGQVQQTPKIELSPASLYARMMQNTTGTQQFNIRNTGSAPLDWTIIRLNPEVENPPTGITLNDPQLASLWNLKSGSSGGINAQAAWTENTGATDLVIAVIDTGVARTHPDLTSNMTVNSRETPGNGVDDDRNGYIDDVHGWDFFANDADPNDLNGHGTHVAGTIAARGNNATGIAGVAWNSKVLAVQFLGPNGSGYTSDAIEAVDYARLRGARVINASWGGGGSSTFLQSSISNFCTYNSGLFVAAAGNDARNGDISPQYPAGYAVPGIVSVASVTQSGYLSYFSNYGATFADVAAPGSDILSCYPPTGYAVMNGTSMAAPHVAGVAALIMSENRSYPGVQVKNALLQSVDALPGLVGKVASEGRVNAWRSLVKTPETWVQPLTYNGTVQPGQQQPVDLSINTGSLTPGNYRVTLALATNDPARPALQIPVDLTVVAPSTLASWQMTEFGQNNFLYSANEGVWAYDADPDHDNLGNLVEYVLGTSPNANDNLGSVLNLQSSGTGASLTFTARTQLDGLSLIAEWSQNLRADSWTTNGLVTQELSRDLAAGTSRWKVTLNPALGQPPTAFFRLRAVTPEP
ncbi:S8 family serine peptidase [Verrucomicrobium sp. BvORR106]|uniref:S8 family serine peptidase n=1 Tax=Verrucomicrobium sp. BvORR106 TaxID=1403819 RepID=UPI000690A5C9|nr:S8 family serine peptidase [Verrucomicrobium sp. BvORR106]